MATIPTFDASGLRTLTLTEIIENIRESIENASDLGPTVSLGAHTIAGMIVEAVAAAIEEVYRLLDDIYASGSPDGAEGVQLDNVLRYRGAVRNPARFSTSTVRCTGTPATPIPAGSIVQIPNGGERWLTDEDIVIGGGGTEDVGVTAENSGPIEGAPATWDIVTGIGGWTAVENLTTATLGELVESDADYRLRSQTVVVGTTTEEAIFTRISELDDVDAAVVVSNRDDDPDALGTDGHTMWIVIYPNTADQLGIANAIWGEAGAPGGIGFRGAVTATVTDDNGYLQQIAWDWATGIDLWVSVEGTKDTTYPADGDTLVKQAIETYFATVRVGADVYPAQVSAAVVNAVPGLKTLTVLLKVGSAPGPTDVNPITVAINEYAVLNSTIGITIT
jgi:uncharacterized phage protein gp47/JayE